MMRDLSVPGEQEDFLSRFFVFRGQRREGKDNSEDGERDDGESDFEFAQSLSREITR